VIEPEEGMVPDNETIPDVISLNDNLTELNTALAAANLTEALAAPGPFTVFAPTDEAFAAVPADVMAALGNDTALLADVLTYHVVEGEYLAADLMDGMNLTTLQGGELLITIGEAENVTDMNVTETEEIVTEENETDMNVTETEETVMEENVTATVMVNEATVVEADIMASNGVIHVIDAVLVPADLVLPANETANETATEEIVLEVTGEAAEEMTEAPAAT
jgi:transforming growth factor-beta-induced protein